MASSSNAPPSASARFEDYEYLYVSNTNVSNFVSVKLSADGRNYLLWKAQMLCLLDIHKICALVDSTFVGPRDYSTTDTMRKYNSLVRGWIFGSVSEDVLADVYSFDSAIDVWDKLKSKYDPTVSLQQAGSAPTKTKTDAQTETKDIVHADSAETNTAGSGECSILDIKEGNEDRVSTTKETKNEDVGKGNNKQKPVEKLREAVRKGDWDEVFSVLEKHKDIATEAIRYDGSTILHIAAGMRNNFYVRLLLPRYKKNDQLLKKRKDGSTALHIAAIVGNKDVAELLLCWQPSNQTAKDKRDLLESKDEAGKQPLRRALENMHLDVTAYLLDEMSTAKDAQETSSTDHPLSDDVDIGVDLLANAISAGKYELAFRLLEKFPRFASEKDDVLVAIAKTFPPELSRTESLLYPPTLNDIWELIKLSADVSMLLSILEEAFDAILDRLRSKEILWVIWIVLVALGVVIFLPIFQFIIFLILIAYFLFLLPYCLLWNVANNKTVPLISPIKNKKKKRDGAEEILKSVCDQVDELKCNDTRHTHYTRPILEAACQNAYTVVSEILFRSPEAIRSKNESGYDIIQLAIMHRSEKIYNLVYDIEEHRELYKTPIDSSKNNILHLAGRLAPSHKLNYITGAALQLQRELQWFEEVKTLVFPTNITQENIFKETPDMVFSREHRNLLKEAEQWMKTTAESCSITAALITTIVFAAAITVPGGTNQERGTPVFREEIAFTIFAISDAISLFASSTALLVFLSILTARFAEKDFLSSLPRRLLIGLFSLLLPTTAMMVAFSATLFLVFCDKKPVMLAPICGLASIPIAFFVTLQFPLMVDLFRSTHIRTFGKQGRSDLRRFDPNYIHLIFQK